MPVVLVVIAPQRSIALLGIRLNWCRPFKVRVIPYDREEPIVGDVQRGELGRFPLSLCVLLGALLVFTVAPFLLKLPPCCQLAILGGNHYFLGGCSDIIFQCRVSVRSSV